MNIEIDIPDSKSGDWRVESFEVSESESRWSRLRSPSRSVYPGTYTRLMRNGTVVMSNTPAEIRDHLDFIRKARSAGGHILINGLGLGLAIREIVKSEEVESITVIEKSEDVIHLVAGTINDPRVDIIHADAFTWKPPKGIRYSAVWHDIWDYISEENLSEMTRLHRKYGRRTDWQGSWCKYECIRQRNSDAGYF